MIYLLPLLLLPPTFDHVNPTRQNGLEVVEYWERSAIYWEQTEQRDCLPFYFGLLTLEVKSWGERYDRNQTRRLQRAFVSLARTMLKIDNPRHNGENADSPIS